jgi:hypothetical protein
MGEKPPLCRLLTGNGSPESSTSQSPINPSRFSERWKSTTCFAVFRRDRQSIAYGSPTASPMLILFANRLYTPVGIDGGRVTRLLNKLATSETVGDKGWEMAATGRVISPIAMTPTPLIVVSQFNLAPRFTQDVLPWLIDRIKRKADSHMLHMRSLYIFVILPTTHLNRSQGRGTLIISLASTGEICPLTVMMSISSFVMTA